MGKEAQQEPCPKCGEWAGWQERWLHQRTFVYTAEGSGDGASEPDPIRGGKIKYCGNCNHVITKLIVEVN